MRTRAGTCPALIAAAMLVAACQSKNSGSTAGGAASSSIVTVTATDFAFDAPAEVPAGLTTFRLVNRGPSLHHIQLIKLEEGKTVDDFLAALQNPGPFPTWATMAGGPNPPEAGDTTIAAMTLEPGSYVMTCFVPTAEGVPHLMKGMVRPLTVTGPAPRAGAEPAADLVMKLMDFDFQLSQPLTAGRHTIRIENDAAQPHEVAIVRLESGKSPMDFASWGERQKGPAPGKLYGGVSGIAPGTRAFATVDLPPGEYGLICFYPDMKDGKPHFAHGMAKRITVT